MTLRQKKMEFKNLKVIGTSHIARESVKEITDHIANEKPHFVAVELDKDRLNTLLNPSAQKVNYKAIRQVGIKGFLFALFGSWASKKMGKLVGMNPGDDMKAAVIAAMRNNCRVALIDQHISITLKRISKRLTYKEKWRFVVDLVKGVFNPKGQMKKYGIQKFDLNTVPKDELIEKMLKSTKERYPNFYSVLVEERNVVMGRRLVGMMVRHPEANILAVIGAGHKEGMSEYIKKNYGSAKKAFDEHQKKSDKKTGSTENGKDSKDDHLTSEKK